MGDVTEVVSSGYGGNVRPQLRYFTHSSGKTVVAQYDNDLNKICVTVISSSDSIEAQSYIEMTSTVSPPSLTICEYDTDEVLIYMGYLSKHAYSRYNINSYAHTEYTVATSTSPRGVAGIWKVGTDWYAVSMYSSAANLFLKTSKFSSANVVTETKTETVSAAFNATMLQQELYSFVNPADSSQVFVYWACNYPSTYNCYLVDLDEATYTDLGSAPFSGYSPGDWHMGTYSYKTFATQLTGGVYTVGTLYYIYMAYTYSYTGTTTGSGIRQNYIVEWVITCNNTISDGTILASEMAHHYVEDSSGSLSASPGYNTGYAVIDDAKHQFYVYYQDIYSGKYQSQVVYEIADITGAGLTFSASVTRGVDNLYFKYASGEGMVYKNFAYPRSYQQPDNSHSYVYCGEPVVLAEYDMTVSYSPTDDPLLTNKDYDFTFTIYLNNVIDTNTNDTYKLYLDGIERGGGTLELDGYFVFRMRVLTAGIHTFIVTVYDGTNALVYTSDSYSYTFVATTTSTTPLDPGTVTTGWANMFGLWIPIMLIVVAPMVMLAIVGGKFGGGTGMVIGMLGGGFAGVIGGTQVNLLPSYILYLYILLIGVSLVLAMAMNRGGGE